MVMPCKKQKNRNIKTKKILSNNWHLDKFLRSMALVEFSTDCLIVNPEIFQKNIQ